MQVVQRVKRWTESENDLIREKYLELSDEELAKLLDRTEKSVANQRQKLKLTRPRTRIYKGKRPKITFEELKQQFEERGYILLSDESEYVNQTSIMRYICKKHYDKGEQTVTVSHFREGKGCHYCGRERTNASRKSKVTEDEDRQLCESKGFEYVKTEFIDGIAYIYFICKCHKMLGIQKMRRGNMNRESVKGCQYCENMNLPHWYVKYMIESTYPHISVLSEYQGMNSPLTCYCSTHNEEFTTLAKNVFHNGGGCKQCARDKMIMKQKLSPEEIQRRVFEKNPDVDILNLDEYDNIETHIKMRCKHCGFVWEQPLASIMANTCRCPNCQRKQSIGEQEVSAYLVDNNIDFVPQYTYDDCKYKNALPFDFAIMNKDNTVKGLIEYQGEQHFRPVDYFGGEEKFELQKIRDNIKRDYCIANNIPLLAIPYWDLENVDSIVEEFIKTI